MSTDGIGDEEGMFPSERRKTERELEIEMDDEYVINLQST